MTDHCGTCGRNSAACPECGQHWPDGTPGYYAEGSWHVGERPPPRQPTAAERRITAAQAHYDQADQAWQQAASALRTARTTTAVNARSVVVDGQFGEQRTDDPRLRELVAAETTAREERDQAGRELVELRMSARGLR